MITYETAKKLKEAGFGVGQTAEYPCYHWYDKDGKFQTGIMPLDHFVHIPTLSELIEACDCEKFMLKRIPNEFEPKYWLATDKHVPGDRVGIIGLGSTPEEAVAELYLTLNNKK